MGQGNYDELRCQYCNLKLVSSFDKHEENCYAAKRIKDLEKEINDAYDVVFPLVPEATDEKGNNYTLAQKIEIAFSRMVW